MERLRLRAAERNARSMYTRELFSVVLELMEKMSPDQIAEKLEMSSGQLIDVAVEGFFTIEQAGKLCYLDGREFVFKAEYLAAQYDPEDNPNGK
jgi:hypothetical protein